MAFAQRDPEGFLVTALVVDVFAGPRQDNLWRALGRTCRERSKPDRRDEGQIGFSSVYVNQEREFPRRRRTTDLSKG